MAAAGLVLASAALALAQEDAGGRLQGRDDVLQGEAPALRARDEPLEVGRDEPLRSRIEPLRSSQRSLIGRSARLRTRVDARVERVRLLLDHYEFGEHRLPERGPRRLRSLVHEIGYRVVVSIRVTGHTDWIDVPPRNRRLSRRRARTTCRYLLRRLHFGPRRCRLLPRGEEHPVARNELAPGVDNPSGRALNRRTLTALTVIGPGRRGQGTP